MYPYINNELDSNLTDNIISRHFNQNLSNELFNYQLNVDQLKNNNYQLNVDQLKNDNYQFNDDQLNENLDHSLINHNLNELNNQKNEEISSQFNQNESQIENNYDQIDPKEIILNKNDKIRDLIKDCELMNNNNINNFVNNYSENYLPNDCSIKLVPVDRCKCSCKHAKNKTKNPFHLIRSNKFISTLSKIKSSQKLDRKSENINQSKCLSNQEDYNTFAPSLSNYSLSSSSSISSQAISVSSCSSVQDNYNLSNTITTVLTKPTRLPPRPPKLEISSKPPMPPPSNLDRCKEDNYLNNEMNKIGFKDEFSIKNDDMRLLTKSFEDLLNIKADCINSKEEDSIYETIDDSDYEVLNDKNDDIIYEEHKKEDKISDNDDEKEDLYEDIDNLNDDEIYESLTKNELSNSLDLLNNIKDLPIKQDNYVNCLSDIDRKLMKQQKILDKKRQLQKEKLKSKFGITGNEIPLNVGVVKKNHKGNNLNLHVNKDEIVLIIRIDGNPAGQWLAKNERGKFGYVYINSVEVDTENLKCLYNEPNLLIS